MAFSLAAFSAPDLLTILLVFVGAVYLMVVSMMAFKERSMVLGLVVINVLIFIYTLFRPELIAHYALSSAKLSAGQGFTLFTYMFFHGNISHLLLNMFGLLFFGYHLEKEMSGPPVIMIYLLTGLLAGGIFTFTAPENTLVIGASGAIFGLMAFLTLIRPFKISPMPFLIPLPVAVASVLYVILLAPVVATGDFTSGVAHNAHFGGLLGGALLAFAMNHMRALKGLVVVIIIAILLAALPPLF